MKTAKITLLLVAILFPYWLFASHLLGGQITWECLNDGRFVFKMSVYRDCSGTSQYFGTEELEVFGEPLPQGGNRNIINLISLYPDSARWLSENRGDLSPICDPNSSTFKFDCSNNNPGAVYALWYKSNPIVLRGVPPSNGWHFRWEGECCRPDVENLQNASSNNMILRAAMYPDVNNANTYPCHDSSPQFLAKPTSLICRGYEFTHNNMAVDRDLDSLLYSFDRTINVPIFSPSNQPYKNPFTPNAPTPGPSINPNNKVTQIDSANGTLRGALFSGVGQPPDRSDYLVVVRVDAYKRGTKVASVYRENPFIFFDCPTLDSVRTPNQKPQISFANQSQNKTVHITAGDLVELPITAHDFDATQQNNQGLQEVTISPKGLNFSEDFQSTAQCPYPPCAVLENGKPTYDSSKSCYQLSGLSAVSTTFKWQTNCSHLTSDQPQPYRFYFEVQDGHCPIPAKEYGLLTVVVHPTSGQAVQNSCIKATATGVDLQWSTGNVDSANFISWHIYKNGQLLDTIANFNQNTFSDGGFQSSDFYQIVAFSTNCSYTIEGRKSDTIRYIAAEIAELNNVLSTTMIGSYQWYDCAADTLIIDSMGQSFAPQDTGNYALLLNRNGCVDTSNCIKVFPVSIEERNALRNLNLFPNPTSNNIQLHIPTATNLDVKVRNLQGKLLSSQSFSNQKQVQISLNQNSGIYFLEISNAAGEKVFKKVVKQ